jgi:antitoxin ParD1/3/4
MSTFEVQFPDHLAQYVASRAKTAGFSNAGDFIVSLVSTLRDRQSHIERMLIEGLESGPATTWDVSELEAIKDRLRNSGRT